MGWLDFLPTITSVINKLIPDKTAAAAATAQLQLLAAQGELQTELLQLQAVTTNQSSVDAVEAANPSVFVAGWRPAIGWVCGFGFLIQFVVAPLATWVAALAGHPVVFPTLDGNTLMSMTFGMLGLGAYHSYDKLKGTAPKQVGN